MSPVRQDVADLKTHFERRDSLYFQLGILRSQITGRSVLEIGPGSGHNSLFTAALKPSKYTLIEGNPIAVQHLNELYSVHSDLRGPLEIRHATLDEFRRETNRRYEFVLCEAMLSGMQEPLRTVLEILPLVAVGGILVVTTMDSISTFAENVRRLIAYRLLQADLPQSAQVKLLLQAFSSHLATLPSMSRLHEDWIVDNILLPLTSGYNVMSIADLAMELPADFLVLSSSPRFISDWRWYKSIVGAEKKNSAAQVATEYWRNAHSLLDHRQVYPTRDPQLNEQLSLATSEFRSALVAFETERSPANLVASIRALKDAIRLLEAISGSLVRGLSEALALLEDPRLSVEKVASASAFKGLFGRGMQYVSIVHQPTLPLV